LLVRLAYHWRYSIEGISWFLDNGAFSYWLKGEKFNDKNFLKTLDKLPLCCSQPDFIVCLDLVRGGLEFLQLSLSWLYSIPADLPVYLAVQDGMNAKLVESDLPLFDGIGITPFCKLYNIKKKNILNKRIMFNLN
jgi:hypothetical protein